MTREEIDTAAWEYLGKYEEFRGVQGCVCDFAIQQVNKALEEAESAAKDWKNSYTDVVLAIRALKIKE